MTIISLKDYAKQNRISYEAVRQQVVRYKDDLEGHIIRDGRQQFLDEEAVAFLDARRQKNPVAIIQMDKDETIEKLKENERILLAKIAEQADKITELQQFKIETIEKRQQLEDAKTAQERRERELAEREANIAKEIKTASQEAADAAKQASDEHWVLEVLKTKEEAQRAREDDERRHQEELAAKERENRELRDRNLWDYLFAPFRKKGKE